MACLEDVLVVLVEPLYGGNLGSVARVMANFGLHRLVLVNPAPGILQDAKLEPMARQAAAGLARSAAVVSSLGEALSDVQLAMGFSTRLGRRRRDVRELRPALEAVVAESPDARIAAVFGREDRGLTTAELDLCHWIVRIPTGRALPSLNLSQAVGLFAYELSERRRAELAPSGGRIPATAGELDGMFRHFERMLQKVDFFEEASSERMMNEVRRIFARRLPDPRDVRILRGIFSKIELALDRTPQTEEA